VVRFTDVYPEGNVSILLGDQMLRMRWRDSWSTPTTMVPNQMYYRHILDILSFSLDRYFVSFNSWPTSFIFSKGHILRIAITSSNYPRYGINNNNGLLMNQLGPALGMLNLVLTLFTHY
jgi:predicted acyl esterase